MDADAHADRPYSLNGERPPWIEAAAAPTYWDPAFGSYGDGYLEWVNDRYYWDAGDLRGIADTRSLWGHRHDLVFDPMIVELNSRLASDRRRGRSA